MNPLILAPTSVMELAPLDFLAIAGDLGYDGVGLRLYPSPHLPFHPVVGDTFLIRGMKQLMAEGGLAPLDIFTFYLVADTDVEAFRPALELGADFGARYAVVQGNDPDWSRMQGNFAAFCDICAGLGLTAIVEFVPARVVSTIGAAGRFLDGIARTNTAILVDPLHLARSGGTPDDVREVDSGRLPFAQFCDGILDPGEPDLSRLGKPMSLGNRRPAGTGMLPLRALLGALPADIALSIEVLPEPGIDLAAARSWAKMLLETTREYLAGQ